MERADADPSPTQPKPAAKASYPLPQGERKARKKRVGYTGKTLVRAQKLRREKTEAEKKLWSCIRNRRIENAKFRDQQPIGPYIADFVCHERDLIVEADGSQHFDSDYDKRRDAFLASVGYRVLRVWNADIFTNMEGVLEAIVSALLDAPSPTSPKRQAAKASYPLPQGERKADGDIRG